MNKNSLFTKAIAGLLAVLMVFGTLVSLRGLSVVKAEAKVEPKAESEGTRDNEPPTAPDANGIDYRIWEGGKVTLYEIPQSQVVTMCTNTDPWGSTTYYYHSYDWYEAGKVEVSGAGSFESVGWNAANGSKADGSVVFAAQDEYWEPGAKTANGGQPIPYTAPAAEENKDTWYSDETKNWLDDIENYQLFENKTTANVNYWMREMDKDGLWDRVRVLLYMSNPEHGAEAANLYDDLYTYINDTIFPLMKGEQFQASDISVGGKYDKWPDGSTGEGCLIRIGDDRYLGATVTRTTRNELLYTAYYGDQYYLNEEVLSVDWDEKIDESSPVYKEFIQLVIQYAILAFTSGGYHDPHNTGDSNNQVSGWNMGQGPDGHSRLERARMTNWGTPNATDEHDQNSGYVRMIVNKLVEMANDQANIDKAKNDDNFTFSYVINDHARNKTLNPADKYHYRGYFIPGAPAPLTGMDIKVNASFEYYGSEGTASETFIRPTTVKATLYKIVNGDKIEVETVELNEGNGYQHTFEGQPKTDGNGNPITYTVELADQETGIVLGNQNYPWDDKEVRSNGNNDAPEFTIPLYPITKVKAFALWYDQNGNRVYPGDSTYGNESVTCELDASNTDIVFPRNNTGTPWQDADTWANIPVTGADASGIPTFDFDYSGISDQWTAYANHTAQENGGKSTDANGLVSWFNPETNRTHFEIHSRIKVLNLTVTKSWVDQNGNAIDASLIPDKLVVKVYAKIDGPDGTLVPISDSSFYTRTLEAGNNWSVSIANLPRYYKNGNEPAKLITYVAEEQLDANTPWTGTSQYLFTGEETDAQRTLTINLTNAREIMKVKIEKTFQNIEGQPTALFELTNSNNQTVGQIQLPVNGSYSYTWENLPADVTYTVVEVSCSEGWELGSITGPVETVANNVKTHTFTANNLRQTVNLSAEKVWLNKDGSEMTAPVNSIQVRFTGYFRNGEELVPVADGFFYTRDLKAGDNWRCSVNGVPKYKLYNGQMKEIVWVATELSHTPGYTVTVSDPVVSVDGAVTSYFFEVVNTYSVGEASVDKDAYLTANGTYNIELYVKSDSSATTVDGKTMDGTTVIKDELSDKFEFNNGPREFEYKLIDPDGTVIDHLPDGVNITSTVNGSKVEFTGFPFNEYPDYELVITIKNIVAKDNTDGFDNENISTNANTGTVPGVYSQGGNTPGKDGTGSELKFPERKVSIRYRYIVYDFGLEMRDDVDFNEFFNDEKMHAHHADETPIQKILTVDYMFGKVNTYSNVYPYVGARIMNDETGLEEAYAGGYHHFTFGFNETADGTRTRGYFQPNEISHRDWNASALLQLEHNDSAWNGSYTRNRYQSPKYEWCTIRFIPATNVLYEADQNYDEDTNTSDFAEFHNGGTAWSCEGTPKPDAHQEHYNDRYGYDPNYNDQLNQDSNGSAMKVEVTEELYVDVRDNGAKWPSMNFDFTGSGFSFSTRCGIDTGIFVIDVVPKGEDQFYNAGAANTYKHTLINTRYYGGSGFQVNDNVIVKSSLLHQVPVIRITDLEYGSYTVYITPVYLPAWADVPNPDGTDANVGTKGAETVDLNKLPGFEKAGYTVTELFPEPEQTKGGYIHLSSFTCYIDTIRVYHPRGQEYMEQAIDDQEDYYAIHELNNRYVEVRKLLISAIDSLISDNGHNGKLGGAMFIDYGPQITVDGKPQYINGKDFEPTKPETFTIGHYRFYGPNNELYLNKNGSYSFSLNDPENVTNLHLSMKVTGAATEGEVEILLLTKDRTGGLDNIDEGKYVIKSYVVNVKSATEMYYDIALVSEGTDHLKGIKAVAIKNNSLGDDAIISIMNIKIVHEKGVYAPKSVTDPDIVTTLETAEFANVIGFGIKGDANGDRSVDMSDALVIMRASLNSSAGLGISGTFCADYNDDGMIDMSDALSTMRKALN